jgi:hypothetical protein
MPTVYTDALYSSTNLGVVSDSTNFFTLSSTNNRLVLQVPGQIAGVNVVGVAYNEADWGGAALAAARRSLTINTYSSGASSGINSLLTTSVSSTGGLTFALLLANRQAINLTYAGAVLTYAADLSAATFDVSDKNTRRLTLLGYIG